MVGYTLYLAHPTGVQSRRGRQLVSGLPHPNAHFVDWHRFTWWKGQFPQEVLDIKGVAHGFKHGLELMQEAMRLGSEAPTRLRKPIFHPLPPSKTSAKSSKSTTARTPVESETSSDMTFRNLAENIATQHDLIFLPLGRFHDRTGKSLFKVAKGVDGRGGLTVYMGENAVFAQTDDGSFKAISLGDMVKRASA